MKQQQGKNEATPRIGNNRRPFDKVKRNRRNHLAHLSRVANRG